MAGNAYGKVNEDEGTPEADRRIKQADFTRLRAQVDNLEGQIVALRVQVDGRDARLGKAAFAAMFFANAASWDGSKVKNFRDWAEQGFAAYNAFMDGAPREGLEARYGSPQVERLAAPKPVPSGNGLAIPEVKAPEAAAATA